MTRAELVSGLANTAEHFDACKEGAIDLLIDAAALLASDSSLDAQELRSRITSAHDTMTAAKLTANRLSAAPTRKH